MAYRSMPRRLFKYRTFGAQTLEMIVRDTVFFADPTTFNDPLDTKPTLDTDIANEALELCLAQLIEERTSAELSAAAQTIRYKGPRTLEHIARQSRKVAERLIADIRYNATNPDYEVDDPEQLLLGQYVQEELLRRYNKGVFSLAERANCPLMWSHYGDQHRGICLGYSVPDDAVRDIHKIRYGGSRLVQACDVSAMLGGDQAARRRVDEAVLLKKAQPWLMKRNGVFLDRVASIILRLNWKRSFSECVVRKLLCLQSYVRFRAAIAQLDFMKFADSMVVSCSTKEPRILTNF